MTSDRIETRERSQYLRGLPTVKSTTRVMSFTSGKGGVGKTNTVVNFGIALARAGKSVLILDADLSLANIDVLLGLEVQYTLNDFIKGRKALEEIIIDGPEGISIIPASSGIESICNLEPPEHLMILEAVEKIGWKYDYLLIDTPAGIGSDVMFFNSASNEVVCVITSDPASLTDAYALIKVLSKKYGEKSLSVIVNNVPTNNQATSAFRRLNEAVGKFLQVELKYLGYIPSDQAVHQAVGQRKGLLMEYPSSKAAMAITSMAERVDCEFHSFKLKGGMQFFFKQLLEVGGYGA
ncbi:MinD/ParA family protein [Oligoflexia bacterium]|nr:MinD/ParA family protein [Oligoflexia bacterium]